ncbi:pyridoxamine 5'-phosphate oxidase [Phytomonospora endophytica]|uniref:Pyridoxine/pyridoxamine 5'-phosphate oxidase n=1 Tax=Phytomonospora endophytica TaxID=714109 RepID=A0A841FV81_9ACTN|nr:pyridoxamine 5'-phosphate oxidase [Phytomonospora endophytica]MBB6037247.1 pyridoxamine 5'-phosphate oxidase [Phytomonospora endophytica]GIG71253.1 pyridoxine/pyridoxamine 5'-phosphate oxidase [Phytomonospora endophytica]
MNTSGGREPVARRFEYSSPVFDVGELAPSWHEQLGVWLGEAVDKDMFEPNAMVLSTADAEGRPSSRTVLLRGFGAEGLTFFTNYSSRKGTEIARNPRVSLLLSWLPMYRQVIVCGEASKVDRAESEEYFHGRPRGSQLASFVSPQSTVLPDRGTLAAMWAKADAEHPGEVPMRDNWGGYRVVPETVEFWQGQEMRMHDRLRFRRADTDRWVVERLAP